MKEPRPGDIIWLYDLDLNEIFIKIFLKQSCWNNIPTWKTYYLGSLHSSQTLVAEWNKSYVDKNFIFFLDHPTRPDINDLRKINKNYGNT